MFAWNDRLFPCEILQSFILLKPCLCNSDIYYLYTIKAFIYILYIFLFSVFSMLFFMKLIILISLIICHFST